MLSYILRRVGLMVPVLLLSSVAMFLLLHLVPGDPALIIAGTDATPEQVQEVRKEFGLDRPIIVQYGAWLWQILQGNAGESFISGRPAFELIASRFPATLTLAVAGIVLAVVISLVLGLVAAYRAGRAADWTVTTGVSVLNATPNFWFGIIAILVFAVHLRVLPPGGMVGFAEDPLLAAKTLLLPACTLALPQITVLTRYMRASAVDALQEDYIRTAVAKGAPNLAIAWRHVLPNSMVPMLTVLGIQFGHLLGGSVVVETVFAWPGIGSLLIDSIGNRDYPVIQGTLLLLVVTFAIVNLVTDILYAVVDPRIRNGMEAR